MTLLNLWQLKKREFDKKYGRNLKLIIKIIVLLLIAEYSKK